MFVFGGLFILGLLLSSPIKEWFIGRVTSAGQQYSRLQPLHEYMSDMFLADFRLAMFFTGLTFALAYAYIRSKLSADLLVISIWFWRELVKQSFMELLAGTRPRRRSAMVRGNHSC